jgi:hypothetical protein
VSLSKRRFCAWTSSENWYNWFCPHCADCIVALMSGFRSKKLCKNCKIHLKSYCNFFTKTVLSFLYIKILDFVWHANMTKITSHCIMYLTDE